MTGDELKQWTEALRQATVAYDFERDDLSMAARDMTADEKDVVVNRLRTISATVGAIAEVLAALKARRTWQ